MDSKERLVQARQTTRQVYQTSAARFDQNRDKSLFEKPWLDRFLEHLPAGGRILDLGCGSGEPIAAYLIELRFQITGVDYAPAMIDLARTRFPEHQWHAADMRQMELEQSYDGIISWNGFFHLSETEQRQVLPVLAQQVNQTGSLLLTVGPSAGEVTGTVAGQSVYHASLAEAEYRQILQEAGFGKIEFCPNDPTCNHHTILLAQRRT